MAEKTATSKVLNALLNGGKEILGRAAAKAGASIAGDFKKVLKREAARFEKVEKGIEDFAKEVIGEIEEEPPKRSQHKNGRT